MTRNRPEPKRGHMIAKMVGVVSTCCLFISCILPVFAAGTGLSISVSSDGVSYNILVDQKIWLRSAPTQLHIGGTVYGTGDGSLKFVRTDNNEGTDAHGQWSETLFEYQPKAMDISFWAAIRVYKEVPLILFGQHFSADVENTTTGDKNKVVSSFPSFLVQDPTVWQSDALGYLAYGGIMFGDTAKRLGRWKNTTVDSIASGLDSGPLILFNKLGTSSMIISPFSQFMAMSAVYEKRGEDTTVSWGVMGAAKRIPKSFHCWTSLTYSSEGVNRLMDRWGEIMRRQYNKDTSYRDGDLSNNYIGYWTDNGAYYYYKTEDEQNYEQTLLDVAANARALGIPYRYIQYDSWWYPKGPKDGVTEWVSIPSVFPSGLQKLWDYTSLPVVAHNRWWSSKTVYAKENGGPYNFIIEQDTQKSIPVDQTFWNDLMTESKKWGLIVYEQDWLNKEFDEMDSTVSDVHLGRTWLRQMGNGAARAGITIQYCMSPSRSALQSLEIAVVSQARVSDDYQPGNSQWKIGLSSMVAHGVGVAPFKDNFWTTSNQSGNPKYAGKTEPYPALEAVVATLSTGPVGPGDKLGKSDRQLIMRSCNTDGLILKPSRPATAIDKQLIENVFGGFSGEVWSTFSFISGHLFGTIFGADMDNYTMTVSPSEAGFGREFPDSMIYPFNRPSDVHAFSNAQPVTLSACSMSNFCLFHTTPVFNLGGVDVLLLGETDKWVPMSPKRVDGITLTTQDIRVTLNGGARERVQFLVLYGQSVVEFYCRMSEAGAALLSLANNSCNPL